MLNQPYQCCQTELQTYFQTKVLPRRWVQLVVTTVQRFQRDRCLEMGAALAFYAFFSLFPILLTSISIIGSLLGPDADVTIQILTLSQRSLPPKAFPVIQETLLQLNQNSVGAGFLGISLMFFSASTIFGCLDRSVDFIWRAEDHRKAKGLKGTILYLVWKKIASFAVVIATTFLLFLSLAFRVALRAILSMTPPLESLPFWDSINGPIVMLLNRGGTTLFMFAAIFLLLYYLPSVDMKPIDAVPGALLATILLSGLQGLVSHNIVRFGSQYQSYGAVSGVMVLLAWIYLSAQIVLMSCELTYVFSHLYGSRRRAAMQ